MTELQSAKILGIPQLDGRYSLVLDMWPPEDPELTQIYPFYDNMKQGRWTTTKCKKCGHISLLRPSNIADRIIHAILFIHRIISSWAI